jgi:hypothetical protein
LKGAVAQSVVCKQWQTIHIRRTGNTALNVSGVVKMAKLTEVELNEALTSMWKLLISLEKSGLINQTAVVLIFQLYCDEVKRCE